MLLRRDLLISFQDFAIKLAESCDINTKVVAAPIRVNNYEYDKYIFHEKNYLYFDEILFYFICILLSYYVLIFIFPISSTIPYTAHTYQTLQILLLQESF